MTRFDKDYFKVGGKIVVPNSMVSKGEGEVTGVFNGSITVVYVINGQKHYTMYSFDYLNTLYGDKDVPFDTP